MNFAYILLTCLFLNSFSAQAELSLNDVSILLPIPANQVDLKTNYLNASTILSTGALISSSRLKLFDWSVVPSDVDMRSRANIDRLAVLGIRLDPCFKDQFSDNCRSQIRLVMQPIAFVGSVPSAVDTGIHLFFDTTPDQILELVRYAAEYRSAYLGPKSYKAPLQIQPVVKQEGTSGKFWKSMQAKLINVLNQATPSRVAFFAVLPSGRAWEFQSFNLKGNAATVIQIPGVNMTMQRINNHAPNSSIEFFSDEGILPRAVNGSDQTFEFLRSSVLFRKVNRDNMMPMFLTLERLENPRIHLPGTVDCLSCHSSPAIKTNLVKNGHTLNPNQATFVSTTLPPASLFNITERNFEGADFRLFGYRNTLPQIGQRVINESAAIVDSIPQ